ncbi:hypothetical protein A7U43_28425 (plasmid) [Mycobacterium adipatum]|uniref:Uncharacterized protein n=2 Tax=Mycobacterium adipatum TaxID=1682113 RepID=A0A172UWG4_9MYCO|nr:hypothetical protein A7U43_28425 [Mycobacterium adipatum]
MWGSAFAVVFVLAGCTGVPDRESEALQIRDRVAAMPGVSDVDLIYENGILEGTRFELRVNVKGATDEQIGAVATGIHTARGDDFAEHDQRIEFDIADGVSLGFGASIQDDPGAVAARLRELDSRITAQSIDLLGAADGSTRIDIRAAAATAAVVDAVLQVFASNPLDQIEVNRPSGPGGEASWWIRTRLSPEQKSRIDAQLAAAVPAAPRLVIVRDGVIERLNVAIPAPETAYDDIVRVIDALGAGPRHRVHLGWSWASDPARYGDLRWSGSVDIGNCDDPNANTGSDPDLLPEARKLQQRIRDEFGPCPK